MYTTDIVTGTLVISHFHSRRMFNVQGIRKGRGVERTAVAASSPTEFKKAIRGTALTNNALKTILCTKYLKLRLVYIT